MFRYIAIAWNPAAPRQSQNAERLAAALYGERVRWSSVFSSAGLLVLQTDSRVQSLRADVLHGQAGVVLGTLFPNVSQTGLQDARRVDALDAKESQAISQTRGMHLVRDYWGDYVAFIRSERGVVVLKAPTGNLPCYVTCQGGLTVVFSSMVDCRALDQLRFTVNWSYVQRRLVVGGMDSDETPIKEVHKLAGGECLHIEFEVPRAPARNRLFYWNPVAFSRSSDAIADPESAARALHATIRNCVNALASGHRQAIHRLSGGLDSSIILGCLAKTPQGTQLACFTYFNPRGRADERPWARKAANFVGAEHFEWAYDPRHTRMEKLLRLWPSVDPPRLLRHLDWSAAEHRLATERGATAVFSGDGGDSVFGREAIDYAADQELRLHGLRPELFRLASQIAVYRDRTVWNVLGGAIRRRIAGRKMSDRRETILHTSRLVRADLRESLVRSNHFPHPWFSGEDDVPWDTVFQIGGLLVSREFYHPAVTPSDAAPETLAPLLSQPIVELCLRIPISVRFENGKDRGLARRAFAREAPSEILRRHWKDRGPSFFGDLLQNNIALVRETLLDGVLVREGLLDRAAVEKALAGTTSSAELYLGEILEHLSVEIWLREWIDERARQAA